MDSSGNDNLITRVDSPTKKFFHQHFRSCNRPVIITEALKGSKLLSLWNADYFKSAIGVAEVRVEVSQTNYFPSVYGQDSTQIKRHTRQMAFDVYADAISAGNNAADKYYMSEELLVDKFPILAADVEFPAFLDRRLHITNSLWFGPAETITPLHYDIVYNISAQVWGRKRFTLFSPDQLSYLYPFPKHTEIAHFSRVNIKRPDFAAFPEFNKAQPIECTLEPGEMLYIPPFWWHQVESLDPAISLSYFWRLSWTQYLARPAMRLVYPLLLDMIRRFRRRGS
jgi:hypothetical protein